MIVTNFDFLKHVDKDLFEIINEAEKLYRDEYFQQCMTQTRTFGENVCKTVLGKNRTTETTFDELLATLKDKISGSEQEKEFIDDLYFLKKHGNQSVHTTKVKKDGMEALECLQRAFEVAINYSVYNKKANSNILKLRYDTGLLVTGKKTKKTLAEKYAEEKQKSVKHEKNSDDKKQKSSGKKAKKKTSKQSYTMSPKKKKQGLPIFWRFVGISLIFSLTALLALFIMSLLP